MKPLAGIFDPTELSERFAALEAAMGSPVRLAACLWVVDDQLRATAFAPIRHSRPECPV